MEARAILKSAKVGVLKTQPVINLVRGRRVHQAIQILSVQDKKASQLVYKLIQSAVANAENTQTMNMDKLYVKEIYVNRGPHRKSFMPRARGSASEILKRTSHICVVLGER